MGNDTGWLHISCALGLKCLALFCDSPVNAYGKYSKNIFVIVPDGETGRIHLLIILLEKIKYLLKKFMLKQLSY